LAAITNSSQAFQRQDVASHCHFNLLTTWNDCCVCAVCHFNDSISYL